jgi:hypothetical protein
MIQSSPLFVTPAEAASHRRHNATTPADAPQSIHPPKPARRAQKTGQLAV